MIARRLGLVLLSLALLGSLAGCGSITNLSEGPWLTGKHERTTPFGGVVLDAQCVAYPFTREGFSLLSLLAFFGGLIDLPLSLVVDAVSLPYTIVEALSPSPPAEKPADGAPPTPKERPKHD